MTRSRLVAVLVLVLALLTASCANTRHRATITVVSAHAVLSAIQDTEMLIVCGRSSAPAPPACVPLDRHREVSAKLATAFDYDGKVAQIVRATPSGALSPDVSTLLGQIGGLVDAVLQLMPDSESKRALVAKVGAK